MTELDFSEAYGTSSFDKVANSSILNAMRKDDSADKCTLKHEQYILMTYDDVFVIICDSYQLILNL